MGLFDFLILYNYPTIQSYNKPFKGVYHLKTDKVFGFFFKTGISFFLMGTKLISLNKTHKITIREIKITKTICFISFSNFSRHNLSLTQN